MEVANDSVDRPEVHRAVRVALQAGSEVQIAGRRALGRRRTRVWNASLVLVLAATGGAVFLVDVLRIGYAFVLLCCAALGAGVAARMRDRALKDTQANSPLSGEDLSEAVGIVQRSADAAQYRDAVVMSGRKLYGIDLAAIRRLKEQEGVRAADALDAAQREWLHTPSVAPKRPNSTRPLTVVRDADR